MSCQGKVPVYILHRCVILLFAFRLKEQELNPAIPKNPKTDGGVQLWLVSRNASTCLRKAKRK
jgi:hypothetical protein